MLKTRLIAFLLSFSSFGFAQDFPVPGQLPSSAFPVCGSSVFEQTKVPQGLTRYFNVPGCDTYPDVNPFWYLIPCFETGTLGFVITPINLGDDYDWMLFDITPKNVNDPIDYTHMEIITGNWTGTYGITGARTGGSSRIECASDPLEHRNSFSSMPTIIKGHTYLLLVSHYTDSQSGYSLSFKGGSAVITDTTQPHLKSAEVACDRTSVTITINKQMRCSSLAANGSDFVISSSPGLISNASGLNCSSGFDLTSLKLNFKTPLSPGTYTVSTKKGSDNNTLRDDCGSDLPEDETASFTVLPPHATPFDSLVTPSCAPAQIQLVFSEPIRCNTIAADGSDFQVTGSPLIHIAKAEGVCTDGLTRAINVTFSGPILKEGNYIVSLVKGSDGNSIINECGVETPVGGQLSFSTRDTVSADFNYSIGYGCKTDTISLFYQTANGVSEWQWLVDSVSLSSLLSPRIPESVFGLKNVMHIVSNGFCQDTAVQIVNLDNTLQAEFTAPDIVCPKEMLSFDNSSIGHIIEWNWNFGDGTGSTEKLPPPHLFPDTWTGQTYRVSLTIKDNLGCTDSLHEQITRLQSCFITVPNAFTPDGNGANDFLYPLNAYKAANLEFKVFNRYGQLVFETTNWTHKWDGTINGRPQPVGTYVWTLKYVDLGSGKAFNTRGTSVLIR